MLNRLSSMLIFYCLRKYFFVVVVILFSLKSFGQENLVSNPSFKLYVFEGSDWCANCIRFSKNILSDSSFISFLFEHHIEPQRLDFPQKKKQSIEIVKNNKLIAEKFHFDGTFPTMILSRNDTLLYRSLFYDNKSKSQFQEELQLYLKEMQ